MRACVVAVLLIASAPALADPSPAPIDPPRAPITTPIQQSYSPPVAWSFVAGLATDLLSVAVGGALMASDSRDDKIAGTYVMMTGLSLAPAISHLTSREWARASIFGALPTLGLLGMTWLLEVHPGVVDEGNKDETRVVYAVLVAWGVVTSCGGLVDTLWAGERARQRSAVSFAPILTRDQFGLALGGNW
jgi:hypothetical protein